MPPVERDKKIEEIYRMVQVNNKMIRSMKRAAFWGTVFKLVLYAVLLGIPVYLYFTIFQPMLSELLGTMQQVQQAGQGMQQGGTNAMLQLQNLQNLLSDFPGVDLQGLLNGSEKTQQ